jgi:hypothetical protein
MDANTKQKAEALTALRASNAQLEGALKGLEAEVDDAALPGMLAALEAETTALRERVGAIEAAGQGMTEDKKAGIMQQYAQMRKEWRLRKRAVMDGINNMCDSMETMRPKDPHPLCYFIPQS